MSTRASEVQDRVNKDLEEMQNVDPVNPTQEKSSEGESADTTNLWADMAEDFDKDYDDEDHLKEDEEQSASTPKDEPVAPKEPEVEETAEVIQKTEIPDQEEVPSDTSPEPAERPVAEEEQGEIQTPPPQQQATPEQIAEARTKAIDELAKRYAMSDDEADEIVRSPETAYPKFAARLFLDVFEAVSKNLTNVMPQVIEQTNYARENQRKAEDGFYKANPLLDRSKHGKVVNQVANMYVKMNPQASQADMVKDVGLIVMQKFGIDPRPKQETPPPVQPAQPYTPAGAQSISTPTPPVQHDNIWSQMADEILEDD